uniref:Uncharacterized protein n=1 Tax=Vespula pensylvanica TaxID=30213 RepID=A0A834NQD7_VESPE|nr:hypothetical protein H0235_012160 [Vespula pensylvanica]
MAIKSLMSRDRVGDNKGLEHNVRATPNLEFSSSRWHKRCLWRPRAASPVELSVTTAQADLGSPDVMYKNKAVRGVRVPRNRSTSQWIARFSASVAPGTSDLSGI